LAVATYPAPNPAAKSGAESQAATRPGFTSSAA
jgi:hypothetical protein